MAIKSFGLRIESEMLDKLHYIAASEDRSAYGQVIYLIRKCIEQFEKEREIIEIGKK